MAALGAEALRTARPLAPGAAHRRAALAVAAEPLALGHLRASAQRHRGPRRHLRHHQSGTEPAPARAGSRPAAPAARRNRSRGPRPPARPRPDTLGRAGPTPSAGRTARGRRPGWTGGAGPAAGGRPGGRRGPPRGGGQPGGAGRSRRRGRRRGRARRCRSTARRRPCPRSAPSQPGAGTDLVRPPAPLTVPPGSAWAAPPCGGTRTSWPPAGSAAPRPRPPADRRARSTACGGPRRAAPSAAGPRPSRAG